METIANQKSLEEEQKIARYVVAKIVEIAGYDADDIEIDSELEAGLGIDSITLVSILAAIDKELSISIAKDSHEYILVEDVVEAVRASIVPGALSENELNGSDLDKDNLDENDSETLEVGKDNSEAPLSMRDFREFASPDLFEKAYRFSKFYREQTSLGNYWYGMPLMSASTGRAVMHDTEKNESREFIMMGSNNYLGLANHPKVVDAICFAARQYGATHTGSRIIAGTNRLHRELEARLANFKGTEDAIVFPSGYSANLGTISALVHNNDAAIVDKFNHMSIIDGCKLSGGQTKIFQHNDMDSLEHTLRDHCKHVDGKLIVVDGVFSMHGDICDLPNIIRLASEYGAKVLVDDAHSTGVLGETGSGTSEHFGLKGKVDLELGTFSKTLSGVGGFVCGNAKVIEFLRFYANSYVFAATIPAHVAAGLIASIDVMETEPQLLKQLWKNVNYMSSQLLELGFDLEKTQSAILPIVIGDYTKTIQVGKRVRELGLYCQTVVFPGVSRGEERLRLSVTSEHSEADIDEAVEILKTVGREFDLIS